MSEKAKDSDPNIIATGSAGNDTDINSYFVDALIDQVIDDLVEKYGVDALRFSLFDGVAIQSDSRFSEKKVELTRNFINKISIM